MMRDNGRLHWIDTAKAIGMILVYMYHAEVKYGCESELLFNLRSPFYVNVFFFMSGFLLYRCGKSASDIARNALLRIYLPSVLVASLLFVPKMMANGGALDFRAFLPDAVGGGAFWFTSALIVAELIWCGIVLLGKDFRLAKITAISAIAATVAIIFFRDENAIMHFNSGMYSMIFLAAGTLFCHFEDKIQIDSGLPVCILTMIVSSVLIIIFGRQMTIDVGAMDFTLFGMIIALASTIAFVGICKNIPPFKPLCFIGQHTLLFYLLSTAVPQVVSIGIRQTQCSPHLGVAIVWAASLTIVYFIAILFSRFRPRLR